MKIKILLGLCSLFFVIASVEAALLVRSRWEKPKFVPQVPISDLEAATMDDPFGADPLDSSFFSDSFQFDKLEQPKWEDHGKELYMVLDIGKHNKGDFAVNITGDQITLTAKDDSATKQNGLSEESHWSNTQSFPLPPDADPKGFRVERTPDRFSVIFKKRESSGQTST